MASAGRWAGTSWGGWTRHSAAALIAWPRAQPAPMAHIAVWSGTVRRRARLCLSNAPTATRALANGCPIGGTSTPPWAPADAHPAGGRALPGSIGATPPRPEREGPPPMFGLALEQREPDRKGMSRPTSHLWTSRRVPESTWLTSEQGTLWRGVGGPVGTCDVLRLNPMVAATCATRVNPPLLVAQGLRPTLSLTPQVLPGALPRLPGSAPFPWQPSSAPITVRSAGLAALTGGGKLPQADRAACPSPGPGKGGGAPRPSALLCGRGSE